jgi:hypothetical protein
VDTSPTQVQQASPEEATNAPTEEQEKNLQEEVEAPPSMSDIPTSSHSSQDQDKHTQKVNNDVLNDDQGRWSIRGPR